MSRGIGCLLASGSERDFPFAQSMQAIEQPQAGSLVDDVDDHSTSELQDVPSARALVQSTLIDIVKPLKEQEFYAAKKAERRASLARDLLVRQALVR